MPAAAGAVLGGASTPLPAPTAKEGLPAHPTWSPAGTLPCLQCPLDPQVRLQIPARIRPNPDPPSPRARACLPLRGGRRRRQLSGAEEAPAAGREVASFPRPGRQRLEPGSCCERAQAARARLLCKKEKATEAFKVEKKKKKSAGAGPPRPRPAPCSGPPRPLLGLQRQLRALCLAGAAAGRRADCGSRARRWLHRPRSRPLLRPGSLPTPRPSARSGPKLSGRARQRRSCGPSADVFGKRWAAPAGQEPELQHQEGRGRAAPSGGGGLTNNNFSILLGGSGLFR